MRLKKFFALLVFSLASALGLSAQSVRVIFVSGQAEIQAPGETNLRAAAKGEVVTLGTRIVTGPDGRMALTPMPGVKALISPNTDLRLESASETKMPDGTVTSAATLDLKTGAVVTDLIKQEGVTYDYNIRTPRGLAGARGTNYTVAVNNAGIETILVSHGTIIFNLLDGRRISVTAGQVNITDVTGVVRSAAQLSELSAEDQSLAKSTAENTLSAWNPPLRRASPSIPRPSVRPLMSWKPSARTSPKALWGGSLDSARLWRSSRKKSPIKKPGTSSAKSFVKRPGIT